MALQCLDSPKEKRKKERKKEEKGKRKRGGPRAKIDGLELARLYVSYSSEETEREGEKEREKRNNRERRKMEMNTAFEMQYR